MNKTDLLRFWKHHLRTTIPRVLCFYILIPCAVLWLLAQPVGDAVRSSDPAILWILLAALGVIALNWFVYSLVRRKHPSLPVIAYGDLCMLAIVIMVYVALPVSNPVTSVLAYLGAFLALAFLLMFSFWCASGRTKAGHATAVVIWVILFLIACGMVYQVARDIEVRQASLDTWLTAGMLIALILGCCIPRFISVFRRKAFVRSATGLAEGRIVQVIGETHLDRDDDPVTRQHARVVYTVDGAEYEIRAHVARITVRRFGRKAFVGRTIPVHYDPADPSRAYTDRIDRHLFDLPDKDPAADKEARSRN